MRIFLALLLSLLVVAPARAASNYDTLFNNKNVWLNTARPLTAEDARGRMVLLDFWTYGCINCMQVVPDLKALEAKYGVRLLVIGVHSAKFAGERDSQRILSAAKRFGLTHPVINDSSFDVWNAFKVQAWPTLVLLGAEGQEVNRYAGEGHREEIDRDIGVSLSLVPESKAARADLKVKDADKSVLSFPARLGFAEGTPWGDLIFVADTGHNRILGATLKGEVKVVIGSGKEGADDGDFASASFNRPRGFAVTKDALWIADTGNNMIRKADFSTKTVTRAAGTGARGEERDADLAIASKTAIASPWDVKFLADGRTLVIAMAGLHQLWTLDTQKGLLSVLAGTGEENIRDGAAADAALAQPSGISVSGENIYFVDAETSSLRVLDAAGDVKTLIGTGLFDFGQQDGQYPAAMMQHAQGLDADAGRIVVADTYNNALRLYDVAARKLSTLRLPEGALSEPGDALQLNGKIYVADGDNGRIAVVDAEKGTAGALPLKLPAD